MCGVNSYFYYYCLGAVFIYSDIRFRKCHLSLLKGVLVEIMGGTPLAQTPLSHPTCGAGSWSPWDRSSRGDRFWWRGKKTGVGVGPDESLPGRTRPPCL